MMTLMTVRRCTCFDVTKKLTTIMDDKMSSLMVGDVTAGSDASIGGEEREDAVVALLWFVLILLSIATMPVKVTEE